MKIRLAKKDDFKDWLNLRKSLWPEYSLGELESEMLQTYSQMQKAPAFVAEDAENTICRFIEVSIRDNVPGCSSKMIGYVEGWYVKPEYRKMGIGRKLISRAETWASARGCAEMASPADEKYPLGPLAHISLGYSRDHRNISFSKPLPGNQESVGSLIPEKTEIVTNLV